MTFDDQGNIMPIKITFKGVQKRLLKK